MVDLFERTSKAHPKDEALFLESIIDEKDDRRVLSLSRVGPPVSALVRIVTSSPGKVGTGFLTDRGYILTAAHVVFPDRAGARTYSLYNRLEARVQIHRTQIEAPPIWLARGDNRADCAVIALSSAQLNRLKLSKLGGLGRVAADELLSPSLIGVPGYDGLDLSGKARVNGWVRGEGSVTLGEYMLCHRADARGGQSGAPILDISSGAPQVIGMHLGYSKSRDANRGIRFSKSLVDWCDRSNRRLRARM